MGGVGRGVRGENYTIWDTAETQQTFYKLSVNIYEYEATLHPSVSEIQQPRHEATCPSFHTEKIWHYLKYRSPILLHKVDCFLLMIKSLAMPSTSGLNVQSQTMICLKMLFNFTTYSDQMKNRFSNKTTERRFFSNQKKSSSIRSTFLFLF